MLKILSFILLIVILIILLFGTDVMNKTNLGDTQLLSAAAKTSTGLYVSESEDKSGEFSGYSHFFYLYLEQPTTTSNNVIKREMIADGEGIKIVLDKHNVMKITVQDDSSNKDELIICL